MASHKIGAAALPKPYVFVDSGGKIWTKNDLGRDQVVKDLKFGTLVITENSGLTLDLVVDTLSNPALAAAQKWMQARGLTEVMIQLWATHDAFARGGKPAARSQRKIADMHIWLFSAIKKVKGESTANPMGKPAPAAAPAPVPESAAGGPPASKGIKSVKAPAAVQRAAKKMIDTGFKGVAARPDPGSADETVSAALRYAVKNGVACAVVVNNRNRVWTIVPATKREAANTYGLTGGYWVEPNGTIWIGKAPT